jgi:threonine synthase
MLASTCFMPQDVPPLFVAECRVLGAEVTLVDGLITGGGRAAAEDVWEFGRFDVSTLKEPYCIGAKRRWATSWPSRWTGPCPM